MAQTQEGVSKWKQSMINKYGSYEKYLEHMKAVGAEGGKKTRGYEFAHGMVDPVKAGAKGGRLSRKNKVKKNSVL